jgi:DNA-binding response OmpR family regulator
MFGAHAERTASGLARLHRTGWADARQAVVRRARWRISQHLALTINERSPETDAPAPEPRSAYNRLPMPGTIMIVEDEPAVARGVQVALEREAYDVTVVPTGEEALKQFADISPDLVLLDVRLPGIDGFEVCRLLRRETRAPILFLTARADEVDKVVGLEIGADDYLVKPFSVRELVSRVKALLRRAYGELADTETGRRLRRGDLVIDLERRRVTRDGVRIALTTTEFDLLRHLAARPGRVYTRGQLLELVRDYEALEADERTINVHISHIREKIEPDPAQPQYIKTVRGVGYAFAED